MKTALKAFSGGIFRLCAGGDGGLHHHGAVVFHRGFGGSAAGNLHGALVENAASAAGTSDNADTVHAQTARFRVIDSAAICL